MKHISDIEIQNYYAHRMNETEERGLLEHVSECEYCAGRWANAFPAQEMLVPPVSFRMDLERQIGRERLPQKRMKSYRAWYQYCAKVILAMGFAIIMLFMGEFRTERQVMPAMQEPKDINVSGQISQQTEKFNDAIKGWSESIGKTLRGEPQE